MGLLDLPGELLDNIINLTVPSGIEAFALCCKAVYARSAPQIQRHNLLKRQWRHTSNTSTPWENELGILHQICRDPLVAQYIESLDLSLFRDRDQTFDFGHSVPSMHGEALGGIWDLVMGSTMLQDAGVDADRWWEEIMEENDETDSDQVAVYTTVSLLSQLPNLKTLKLPHRWYYFHLMQEAEDKQLFSVLDAIVDHSNDEARLERPLGRLQVILPSMLEGYEERAGLQCLQPFMALKSLRELYAVSCIAVHDSYTGIPFQWRFPELTSPLTRLELAYCCMDADGISALLSHTPSLTVFRYSHQTKWHGCQYDWNPGAFNEAIARHCGQTITKLAITIDVVDGDICNGVSSFHSFPNLDSLELDVRIFCGPPLESGQERGLGGRIPEGETPWTEEDIPCLGCMLPASLVDLQINTDFLEPEVVALRVLLKDFKSHWEARLKNLTKVVIRQYNGDSARDLAERVGAMFDVFISSDGTQTRPRSRAMMPAWKRQFEEICGIQFA